MEQDTCHRHKVLFLLYLRLGHRPESVRNLRGFLRKPLFIIDLRKIQISEGTLYYINPCL